jgi:hypothetical protein
VADAKWDVNVNVESSSAKAAAGHVDKLEAGLKAVDKAAGAARDQFGRFLPRGTAGMKALGGETDKATGLLGKFGAAAGEARAKTSEFLEFFGAEAALDVLKEIGEKVIDIGEEAVRSAAKAERMHRVFGIVQGGKEKGEQAEGWVHRFSKTSEFSEEQNESAFAGLRKAGVDSQRAGLMMKAAGDVAAGSVDKDAAYQEAISAFERIHQTGKVNARMLRPLGIGVEDFKKLPQFKGMSNQKVNAALATKNVDENELFQLIMAHAGETKVGQRSADNVNLLSTKMAKLEELPELFYKKLGDTKAVGELSRALDGALTKLDPDSPDGAKIFGGLESAFSAVADAVGTIDFGAVAEGAATLAADLPPAVALIKEMGADAKVAAHYLSDAFDVWEKYTPAGMLTSAVGKSIAERMAKREGLVAPKATERMMGFDYTAAKALLHANGGAHAAAEGPVYEAPGLDSLNANVYGTGKAIPEGLAAGVRAKADVATDAVGALADHMVETVKRKHKTHSPSEVFSDIGAMDIAGYVGGVRGGRSDVAGAMSSTFEVPHGGSRAAAGGVNVTLHTTVNVDGGKDGGAQGKKAANAYNEEMRAQILAVLEQALAGGGG